MKMNLLLTAAATACLLSTPATAAMVRIQTAGSDPAHVDQTIFHPIFASIPGRAEADLLGGNFKVFAEAIGAFDETSIAAMDTAVVPGFTNMSGQTMNLQPGWFSAHVAGDITLSPAPGSGNVDSTQVTGVLTLTHNFVTSNATGKQIATTSCPGCGPMETATFTHQFDALSESNGATVQLNFAFLGFPSGFGGLDMDLIMPAIVLAPGETFTWWFRLSAITNSGPTGGNAVADFFNAPTLSIVLPVGFVADDLRSVDGRDGSDFVWITTAVPNPVPTLSPTNLSALILALMTFGVVLFVRRNHQQSIARL